MRLDSREHARDDCVPPRPSALSACPPGAALTETAADEIHSVDTEVVQDATYLRIRIDPALACGLPGCGRMTNWAQIERDDQMGPLWRMLPLCETHLVGLAAGAHAVHETRAPRAPRPRRRGPARPRP